MGPRSGSKICQHDVLRFEPSHHAEEVGATTPSEIQLAAAAKFGTRAGRQRPSQVLPSTFPAPLVLPDDALAIDADEWEGQTVNEWRPAPYRNEVTNAKRVLYLVPPPTCSSDVANNVEAWATPLGHEDKVAIAMIKDVAEYLMAFYHGMKVCVFTSELSFVEWEDQIPVAKRTKKAKNNRKANSAGGPSMIGLRTPSELIGIRTRDCHYDKQFRKQINLTDLLDVAIAILPKDAYALLMLLNHDLYEDDDDDDFACGRAYGGSRIACVSTARYNPCLDQSIGLDLQHAWPASHCDTYMRQICKHKRRSSKKLPPRDETSPMQAALSAFQACSSPYPSSTWLERVCRIAAHELGHCFGIAHCPYYACSMQATTSVAEDIRQPPYLCPVDLAKVLHATGGDVFARYEALRDSCEKRKDGAMFAAFAAWLAARLDELAQQTTGLSESAESGSTRDDAIMVD